MKVYARLAKVELGDGFPVRMMGVINVSPESFYKGSVRVGGEEVAKAAVQLVEEGVDLIDIGAKSTAPYLQVTTPLEVEVERMVNAVKIVKEAVDVPISADTTSSIVADRALNAGAEVVNDISGLKFDPYMAKVVADHHASLIISAREAGPSKGRPTSRVIEALKKSLQVALEAGVGGEEVVIDPAIGFFRNTEYPWYIWDSEVIINLEKIRVEVGRPICIGVSRKSFVGTILSKDRPEERLYGSLSSTAIAIYNGADLVRTHDVAPTLDVVKMAKFLRDLRRKVE